MRAAVLLAMFLSLGVSTATARQQVPADPPPQKRPIPTEGFWPTRTMVDRILDRISDDLAQQYKFDDDQRERTRAVLKEFVPRFMDENRAEIQDLTNQFIEAQLHDEPPNVADIAKWSARVLPLVDKFNATAEEMTGKMREYMSEEQIVTLEAEFAAMQAGIGIVKNKLGTWSEGGFDPETEWTPPGPERRRRDREEERRANQQIAEARERARAAAQEAAERGELKGAPEASTQPGVISKPMTVAKSRPTDEWEILVDEFIKRYDLNDDQQQKARGILQQKMTERDKYLQQKTSEMDNVTKQALAAKTAEEKQAAKEAGEKLRAPVERMLAQLKDRLDGLPTRAQRQAAARKEAATTQPTAEPKKN